MFDLSFNIIGFLLWAAALILAITIHEFAHAYAAEHLGDPTPRLMGRLTLNPLAHLDPLGTILLLIARFGWGKPVQFDPFNLRHPRRDSAIISIAGPTANILLAIIASVALHLLLSVRFTLLSMPSMGVILYAATALLEVLVRMNVLLAVFNLIPIHPLDGFKIVEGILPEEYARQWKELEPYGMIFLFFLIFPILGSRAPISNIISPIMNAILSILLPVVPLI
jgi:Zn-dependent protease